jgi:hypothetical protein
MAEVNKVAAAAAMAKRPNVRFVIMGLSPLLRSIRTRNRFLVRERIGNEKDD